MKKMPVFLKKYFWDTEFESIDMEKNREYILKNILNYGDEKAVEWMYENFKKGEIIRVLSHFRGYSLKSANYWALILDVPKKEVLCLKKHSSREQRTFWHY